MVKAKWIALLLISAAAQGAVSQFGKTKDGKEVLLYSVTNANGVTMKVLNLGARLHEMIVPDAKGKLANVTLNLPTPAAYEKHDAHFGGTIGRYANRIAKGKFTLDGKAYSLATNNAPNHLHGGVNGFDSQVWKAKEIPSGVELAYSSKDKEEGYPGTLNVTVTYVLTDKNELKIDYRATTDKATVVSLSNHAYWNLGGVGAGNVLDHVLTLEADKFLPIDETSIPTGELKSVKGTPMDFTDGAPLVAHIHSLKATRGYDHCYVIRGTPGDLRLAASVYDPNSGRQMQMWTTEPGVQLYIGNFLDGGPKNGGHRQYSGFCLEAEKYPDSPNRPEFPSAVLRPGETYRQTTIHKFLTRKL